MKTKDELILEVQVEQCFPKAICNKCIHSGHYGDDWQWCERKTKMPYRKSEVREGDYCFFYQKKRPWWKFW